MKPYGGHDVVIRQELRQCTAQDAQDGRLRTVPLLNIKRLIETGRRFGRIADQGEFNRKESGRRSLHFPEVRAGACHRYLVSMLLQGFGDSS